MRHLKFIVAATLHSFLVSQEYLSDLVDKSARFRTLQGVARRCTPCVASCIPKIWVSGTEPRKVTWNKPRFQGQLRDPIDATAHYPKQQMQPEDFKVSDGLSMLCSAVSPWQWCTSLDTGHSSSAQVGTCQCSTKSLHHPVRDLQTWMTLAPGFTKGRRACGLHTLLGFPKGNFLTHFIYFIVQPGSTATKTTQTTIRTQQTLLCSCMAMLKHRRACNC